MVCPRRFAALTRVAHDSQFQADRLYFSND
jgi:hypothetical protein